MIKSFGCFVLKLNVCTMFLPSYILCQKSHLEISKYYTITLLNPHMSGPAAKTERQVKKSLINYFSII